MNPGIIAILLCGASLSAYAQSALQSNSLEVVVDLVVRDKRGRPIKDLAATEVTIQSEGKTYAAKSLRWVSPSSLPVNKGESAKLPAAVEASASPAIDPTRDLRFVTLLFEPLPRESTKLAQDATYALIEKAAAPNLFFSVFLARERLKLVQGFSADSTALKQAIKTVTMAGGFKQVDDMVAMAESQLKSLATTSQELDRFLRGQVPVAPSGPGVDQNEYIRAQQARLALDMLSISDSFQRQDRGRVSLNALRAAINALGTLPGRKTIVYVCRGLGSHPSLSPIFQNLIEAANAKGVTIYGIDVSGLEQSERTREAANMLARAAAASIATITSASDKAVTREEAMAFETAEQSALANPVTLLAELASSTGGLVLSDTNDSRKIAQQIAEDISSYWELTYNPDLESFDGSFHPIAVKVKRKDVKLQSRKGFFALAPGDLRMVEPFETPLLKALAEKVAPAAMSFEALLLDAQTEKGLVRGEVVVETPISEFDLEENPTEKTVRVKASVLAFLRNEAGEVSQRLSQQVDWRAPLEQLELVKKGTFQWHKSFEAAPGKYTLEVAMSDRASKRLGVKRIPVVIAGESGAAPRLGAVARVRVEAGAAPTHPDWLKFNGAALTPYAIGELPLAGAKSNLAFLLPIQPGADRAALDVKVEIVRDGKALVELPVPLDEATRKTKTPFGYVLTLPTEELAPGQYEFRFQLTQGKQAATRSALLKLNASPDYKPPVLAPVESAAAAPVEVEKPIVLAVKEFQAVNTERSLSPQERELLYERIQQTGRQWADSLINFTCLQITDRSFDRQGNGQWKKSDTIREMVTYYNGKESYEDLAADPIFATDKAAPKSVRSFGEFGGMMRIVLGPKVKSQMEWKGFVEVDGRKLHRISYKVAQANSGYRLTREQPFEHFAPGYEGEIFAEEESLLIRRITLRTQSIPDRFHFQDATHEIDYDFTRISGQSYLLPIRSVMQTRTGKKRLSRSEIEFSNYRKWASDSKIQFDTAAPIEP